MNSITWLGAGTITGSVNSNGHISDPLMNDDESMHHLVDKPGRQHFIAVLVNFVETDLTLIKNK
jgi:hypothetical protein